VSDSDLPRYHATCDIFVCPSLIENHPITILEAMAAKMPIVATNAGGIKTILKNEYNGLLVSENGWKGFAEKIKVIIEDKTLAKELSENAFEDIIKNYTYPSIASKFHNLCQSLLR
jgi:glycosyltransferase involved in cell wall biosynthesis